MKTETTQPIIYESMPQAREITVHHDVAELPLHAPPLQENPIAAGELHGVNGALLGELHIPTADGAKTTIDIFDFGNPLLSEDKKQLLTVHGQPWGRTVESRYVLIARQPPRGMLYGAYDLPEGERVVLSDDGRGSPAGVQLGLRQLGVQFGDGSVSCEIDPEAGVLRIEDNSQTGVGLRANELLVGDESEAIYVDDLALLQAAQQRQRE